MPGTCDAGRGTGSAAAVIGRPAPRAPRPAPPPRPRSRPARRARRASGTPRSGCARTASPSAAAPPGCPASCPAPVGSTGAASRGSQRAGQPVAQRRVELHRRRDRLPAHADLDPVSAAAARRAAASISADQAVQRRLVRRPGVQPGVHRRADRVGAARLGADLAERGQRAACAAAACRAASTAAAYGSIGSRRSASRVVPAWSASPVKSNRQRPCGQMPSATRPRRRGRPARGPARRAARRTRRSGQQLLVGAEPRRVEPGRRPSPRPGSHRRRRAAPARRPASIAPVSSRLPRQATPNRPPSSSENAATATGRAGREPAPAELVDRRERGHHAERAVEGPAVRDRVQVAAGDDRSRPATPAGTPTRPTGCRCGRSRAHPALVGRRSANQAAAGRVRLGPGEPPVARR